MQLRQYDLEVSWYPLIWPGEVFLSERAFSPEDGKLWQPADIVVMCHQEMGV